MFREERHELFERAIRETLLDMDRSEWTVNIAADLLPIAFQWYQSIDIPLDNDVDGRTRMDVYLSTMRGTAQSFSKSWFARTALKILGLEKILDVAGVYCARVSEFSKTAELFRREQEKYDSHYKHARKLASEYCETRLASGQHIGIMPLEWNRPCQLYASLKTWKDDMAVERMANQLETYSALKWELVVQGPIQLLLQVGSEGFVLVWRALNWTGSRDEPRARDAKVVADDLEELLRQEDTNGVVRAFSDLLMLTIKNYVVLWKQEQNEMRILVPPDGKDRFFRAFEQGTFFAKRCAENAQCGAHAW